MLKLWRRWYILVIAALVLGGGAWWYTSNVENFKGRPLASPTPAPVFQLTDADGNLFRLDEERGKVVLLFFGYTNCPDACPLTLRIFQNVANNLGDLADQVRLLFVTVDPERDTPERVRSYLARYGNRITGLVGSPEELEAVWEAYGIRAERVEMPDSALGYSVLHTTYTFLIDQEGRLRLLYTPESTPDEIVHDIRQLIRRG